MSIQTIFTAQANAAAERYDLLTAAWRGLYEDALNSRDFGTPKSLADILANAYTLTNGFIDTERLHLAAAFDEVMREALQTTGTALGYIDTLDATEALSEHLNESMSYLMHELLTQIERDIVYLKSALGRTTLQITLAARASGKALKMALMQYKMGNGADLQFFFHDRRAAKWVSRKYVRSAWRHALLTFYNEAVLMILADHGKTRAQVQHVNPSAESHGMILSLTSDTSLPTYMDLRNEVFHPNSDAVLTIEGTVT